MVFFTTLRSSLWWETKISDRRPLRHIFRQRNRLAIQRQIDWK